MCIHVQYVQQLRIKASARQAQNVCIFLRGVLTKHFVLTSSEKNVKQVKQENVCEVFFPITRSVYKFMHSISAKPARNSLVFTFKAVLSVNSTEPAKPGSQASAEDFPVRTESDRGKLRERRQIESIEA